MAAVPPTVAAEENPDRGDLSMLGYGSGAAPRARRVRVGVLLRVDTHHGLPTVHLRLRRPGLHLDLADRVRREVLRCAVLRRAGDPLCGRGRDLSTVASDVDGTRCAGWPAGSQLGYISVAAITIVSRQAVLPEVWGGLQLVGADASPPPRTARSTPLFVREWDTSSRAVPRQYVSLLSE